VSINQIIQSPVVVGVQCPLLDKNFSSDVYSLAHRHELDTRSESANVNPRSPCSLDGTGEGHGYDGFSYGRCGAEAAVGRPSFYQSPQQQAGAEHMGGHANHPKPGTLSGSSV
jgi:hypothetical protein